MSEVETPTAEVQPTPEVKDTVITPPTADVVATEVKEEPAPNNKPGDEKSEPVATEKTAESEKASENEKPKAPEKYELKSRKDSPLLKADLEEIEADAKARGLSQEDAQKVVEGREADHDRFFKRQQDQARDQMASWRKEVESDKEISGSDGKLLKENLEVAKRALDVFADDSFKKILADSGLGNNPHLVRTFLRIGRKIGVLDDKAVLDGKSIPPTKKVSREQKLFPSHFQKE